MAVEDGASTGANRSKHRPPYIGPWRLVVMWIEGRTRWKWVRPTNSYGDQEYLVVGPEPLWGDNR